MLEIFYYIRSKISGLALFRYTFLLYIHPYLEKFVTLIFGRRDYMQWWEPAVVNLTHPGRQVEVGVSFLR
jgi:hypothetical protein